MTGTRKLPMPQNVNVAHMSIMEDRYRFSRIRNGVVSNGWSTKNVKLSHEDYEDTFMAIMEKVEVIKPGKDNYWVYITVNKADSTCQLKDIHKLQEEFFPWIKLVPYHTSVPFTNGNYFQDNYLQFHIFKLEF